MAISCISCQHCQPGWQVPSPACIWLNNAFNSFNSALSCSFVPVTFSFFITRLRTSFARCANFKVDKVSPYEDAAGLMLATILVLLFPPSESFNKQVSFVSRYGTNLLDLPSAFQTRALITLPIADSDLLMDDDSLRRSPYAPVSFCLSDPARSIR